MRAGISESTRPAAAKELDRPQIINNRPLAVSLPRPDEFLRLAVIVLTWSLVMFRFLCPARGGCQWFYHHISL